MVLHDTRMSDVAREPFLFFEHELCKSHMLSDGVFLFLKLEFYRLHLRE